MAIVASGRWRRLWTLGRGASGAVVSLAEDIALGQMFAVKSAGAESAAMLRREHGVLARLSSSHIVRCIGDAEELDRSYHLFLEYAPGGSLADEVARNGGCLGECAIRAYAADVLLGLAYLHGAAVVHGDVKAQNVVIGADGRAKLADFGCARAVGSARPVGGMPVFMSPEVARGEEQGPAADVWTLGCMVIEMATGRAPWSGTADDVLATIHRIGYTDVVPEAPSWLSAEAKDFLVRCFARDASHRLTATRLLEHPFVPFACHDQKARWPLPTSTRDTASWERNSNDEAEDAPENAAEKIKSLAGPTSALPNWDGEEGWIDVLGEQKSEVYRGGAAHVAPSSPNEVSVAAAAWAGGMAAGGDRSHFSDELEAEGTPFGGDSAAAVPLVECQNIRSQLLLFQMAIPCNGIDEIKLRFLTNLAVLTF